MVAQSHDSEVEAKGGVPAATAVGVVELVIAAGALYFAWRSLTLGEGTAGAGFWGWLALVLFCALLAPLNLFGPWLRTRFGSARPEPRRLPIALRSIDGARDTTWSILMLGIAFFAPAFPLLMMALRMRDSDVVLLVIGACLACAVLGAILLWISGSHLYKMLSMGEAIVEIGAEPVHVGGQTPAFISYRPGRLAPERIMVEAVCRKTTRETRRSGSGPSSYVYRRSIIHEAPIASKAAVDSLTIWPWQASATVTIPVEAAQSTDPTVYPTIDWGVEVVVSVANSPDFRLNFPFQVELT